MTLSHEAAQSELIRRECPVAREWRDQDQCPRRVSLQKKRHAMLIEFYAGKTVTTFLPIQRTYRRVNASLPRLATEQSRDLAVCHPDLRHAIYQQSSSRGYWQNFVNVWFPEESAWPGRIANAWRKLANRRW